MLVFDDAGLARVFIAATGIAPGARHRWLADIAKCLERAAPSRGAHYTHRCHARAKAGLVILQDVVVEEVPLALALIELGSLIRMSPMIARRWQRLPDERSRHFVRSSLMLTRSSINFASI